MQKCKKVPIGTLAPPADLNQNLYGGMELISTLVGKGLCPGVTVPLITARRFNSH